MLDMFILESGICKYGYDRLFFLKTVFWLLFVVFLMQNNL